jgi:hypothetical protein
VAKLVRVRKGDRETTVSQRWLDRWPNDFTPVGEEPETITEPVVDVVSPTGDEEEE